MVGNDRECGRAPPANDQLCAGAGFASARVILQASFLWTLAHGFLTLLTTIIGLGAAICTTSSFLPQVIKAWRSRSTHDISTGMFVLLTTGNSMWLLYGR